jgi:type IV secretory pathway TrbF-like protein
MSDTPFPPSGYEFGEAPRRYVEQYGSAVVMNTYLRIALLCVTVVCLGLLWLQFRADAHLASIKPLVIRIDGLGRAQAISYDALTDRTPQPAELRYFLTQFVTKHYGRIKATLRQQYAESLYFLDPRLAQAAIDVDQRTGVLARFLAAPPYEIDIAVTNVALEDLKQPPYRATVYFQKVYYAYPSHEEQRRETYVAHLVVTVRDQVPNAQIPVNPLGLSITDLHLDQAFQ